MMAVSRFHSMIHDLSRPRAGRSSRGVSLTSRMPRAHGPLLLLALGLTALGLLLCGGAPAQAATGTASISGAVTDSEGHAITTEDVCVSADPTGPYDYAEGGRRQDRLERQLHDHGSQGRILQGVLRRL